MFKTLIVLLISYIFYYFTKDISIMLIILAFGASIVIWGSHLLVEAKRQDVNNASANIDSAFQKRHDLLMKLIDTAKAALCEREKDRELILNLENKFKFDEEFEPRFTNNNYNLAYSNAQHTIKGLISSEANLVKNQFELLSRSINDVEENLFAARRFYNYSVKEYNEAISQFPSNIFARIRRYEKEEYFEVENKEIRKDIKIELK